MKTILGISLILVAVVSVVIADRGVNEASLQYTQDPYNHRQCGLPNTPGYVKEGCVTLEDPALYGICGFEQSPYISWCDNCYSFDSTFTYPGETTAHPIATHYTGSIKDGTTPDKIGNSCEFNTANCPDYSGHSEFCFTTSPVESCLLDYNSVGDATFNNKFDVMTECCGITAEACSSENPPARYGGAGAVGCLTCVSNPATGCCDCTPNNAETCIDKENKCLQGTCQYDGIVGICADQGPRVCATDEPCQERGCDSATGCLDPAPVEDGLSCTNDATDGCLEGGVCDAGLCAGETTRPCEGSQVCNSATGLCENQFTDLLPIGGAALGGLCLIGAAGVFMAKKRNSMAEDGKRDSVMTQKTDNYARAPGIAGAGARQSGMSQVSKFTRAGSPGRGSAKFDQVSQATRRSMGSASRGSRVSKVTTATRSSRGSDGRRSSGGRSSQSRRSTGRNTDYVSSGTRSSGGRSSASSRSRKTNASRSSQGSRSRSQGSRGRNSVGRR